MRGWRSTTWRWSGAGWSARRPPTSWARGACARCSSTGPMPGRATDAGAGILSPETPTRDDPTWIELVRAAGEHYEQLVPAARRRHGLGALRHPAARDARRATFRRGNGSPNARPARPRSVPTTRARWCRCSATSCARFIIPPRHASTGADVRGAAARRGRRVRRRGARRSRSTTCARSPADAVVIAGGAWIGAVRRAARGARCPSARCAVRSSTSGVADHDTARGRSCSPCSATTWCRGPTRASRSARPSRTPVSSPMATAGGVHEVLRETLRVHARPRGRDAARSARRTTAGQRRRHADPRRAPRRAERVRRNRSRRRTACCSARSRARSSPTSCAAVNRPLDLAPFRRRRGFTARA